MSRSLKSISVGIFIAALAIAASGCKKAALTAAPSAPEVSVTPVIQQDVTTYADWVGTTQGFVNADIFPKISGYLLKQNYRDGDVVKAYRRQLSRNHPDKLKANGLPESMIEHAKQRTQQIIEAYELIKERRGLS